MSDRHNYEPKRARRSTRLAVRGVSYEVSEWGSSGDPLIVYLHGWGDTGSTFQFVVDEFQRDWFVVAPDWRGFGGSSGDASAYWFPDYLADLDHLLMHYSPDAPVCLVGHSMGGNVAGLYAGSLPERVAKFVNVEGFGLPDTLPTNAPRRYRDWIECARSKMTFSERENFSELAKAIQCSNTGMRAAQAEFVARLWAQETADGMLRLRANPAHKLPNPVLYRRAEAEACWAEVTAEVLLISGRNSKFASPGKLPFPHQETAWIEGAGHMLHFEQPAALALLIEEFLAKPIT